MEAAREIAKTEGVAVNQLINVAVAQMIAVHRASSYMTMRAARANPERALEILHQAGRDNPPIPGDELPGGRAERNREKAAAKS
jgi:hypothetical protein